MTDEKLQTETEADAPQTEVKTVEEFALQLGTANWALAAARAVNKWGIGKQLTHEKFEAGVALAVNQKINP